MKKTFIIFFFVILCGCKSTKIERTAQTEQSPTVKNEKTFDVIAVGETLEDKLKNLTGLERKKLDERIPPKVRERLENAEELEILSSVEYKKSDKRVNLDIGSLPFSANKTAKITDKNLMRNLLNAIYLDSTATNDMAGCWTPHHGLKTTYKNKTVTLGICYHCGHFRGKSPSGNFGGAIASQNSLSVFDSIIEKYGADVQ